MNVLDLNTKQFKCYKNNPQDINTIDVNNIFSLYKDSQNNIWIGTTVGINLYNRKTDDFSRLRKLSAVTIDILQHRNILWFATIGYGLHAYDLTTHQWTNYKFDANDKNSLVSNEVLCLCVDDDDQLWVGTNSGLCKFERKEKSFKTISLNAQSNTICKIINDKEFLWIATTKGLIRFDPKRNQLRSFTTSDGLLSDLFILNSGIKHRQAGFILGQPMASMLSIPSRLLQTDMSHLWY